MHVIQYYLGLFCVPPPLHNNAATAASSPTPPPIAEVKQEAEHDIQTLDKLRRVTHRDTNYIHFLRPPQMGGPL